MKGRSGYPQKVVPISPYFRRPPADEQGQEKELPADLATVQRWLNYADIALNPPAKRPSKSKDEAA